ncbi:MAG TPA: acyl-CoA reductase [Symbiobacteriaceae bacterium]|jgi:acyl-CoA reductase-like NAD-dependent aldehyde dehydrogenase
MLDQLLAAQKALAERPVGSILATLDRVADRWLDEADPIRREAESRLAESTGLAPAMLRRGLDDMLSRVRGIGALLDADLGDRAALDTFVDRAPGMRSRAYGPGLLVAVFSGNVPGIPAFDMALALALKSACLARPASEEPVFAELFARSVAAVDADLGRCLGVAHWPHDAAWPYAQAGAVLAYGADESVAAVRALTPAGARFVGHGHKISFAVVAREAATAETAARLAYDVAMYDQQGCVSPHMAFVERGGPLAPAEFARACGSALAEWEQVMPRGRLTAAEAMSLRAARDEAEFMADGFFGSLGNLAWAVAHSETPRFLPSPLNRLLRTFAVDDVLDVGPLVAPFGAYLQTVAFAGGRAAVVGEMVGRLGASRVCRVGAVQSPSPLWRHDGVAVVGALVRWVDMEGV